MGTKVNLIGLNGELVKKGVELPDPINDPQWIIYQNRLFYADFEYGAPLKKYSEESDGIVVKD